MNSPLIMEPKRSRSPLLPWLGAALLGASWLPGLGYYQPASTAAWLILIVGGVLLMYGTLWRSAGRIQTAAAVVLTLPVLWLVPWNYKIAPLLMIVGATALAFEPPKRWFRNLAGGILAAGIVLLAQSLAVMAYESFTARSHELPLPVAQLLGAIAQLLGSDAAVTANTPAGGGGVDIALRTMRKDHHLGATWELLLDPPTLAFFAAGISMVLLRLWNGRTSDARRASWSILSLAICLLIWLPIRAGVLMALVLHRALRTDFDATLKVMDAFYSPWVLLLLLLPLALLVWRCVPLAAPAEDEAPITDSTPPRWRFILPPALVGLAIFSFTFAVCYDPIGTRKPRGRIIVDEYHTRWEPTQIPFDTNVYGHDSGYNYAAIYDYSSRFYDVSRLLEPGVLDCRDPRSTAVMQASDNRLGNGKTSTAATRPGVPSPNTTAAPAIDDRLLDNCDIFILKCPTVRLYPDEIESLRKFVQNGGGLLLIGEHTDVFGLGTNVNDVARPFGFQFRYDILFNIDEAHPFDYLYNKPLIPHPIVQWMPPLDFEGPCTIEPTGGSGHAVMLAVGQRGEPAHYYASNFMPPPEDRADSRYGAWVVLWSTKYGKGRVVAHADSTQWSNFSAFEAGKPESWIGMVEWLNHENGMVANPRIALEILGIVLLLAGIFGNRAIDALIIRRNRQANAGAASHNINSDYGAIWLVMIGSGMFAFFVAATTIRAINDTGMPIPPRKPNVEMINVGIDRTISDGIISKGGFIGGLANGYGIFERWILRLGWFTQRGGPELLDPDKQHLVVYLLPSKDVTDDYRDRLVRYVEAGGKILVVDTPPTQDRQRSTANSLLKPFGMELKTPYTPITGDITSTLGLPTVVPTPTYELTGADEILATCKTQPVAGTRHFGKGSVTAIGFGSRFSDTNMGITGDVNPDPNLLKLYDVEYGILRHLMDKPVHAPTTAPVTRPASPLVQPASISN